MRRLTAAAMAAAAFAGQAATVPYFPSASDPDRQGFVRAINHSAIAGEVSIAATDDAGMALDPVALPIAGNETVHFNSDDLETGSETKGIRGIGGGQGDWRLEIASGRGRRGACLRPHERRLPDVHAGVVPRIGNRHRIATFNPASNVDQRSLPRLANQNDVAVEALVVGVDGTGSKSELTSTMPPGRALGVSARDLESGAAPTSGSSRSRPRR